MGGIPFSFHDESVEDFFVSTNNTQINRSSINTVTQTPTSGDLTTTTTVKSSQSTSLVSSNTNSDSDIFDSHLDVNTSYFFYPFRTYKEFITQLTRELVNNVFGQLRNIPPSYYHQMVAHGYYPSKNNTSGSKKNDKNKNKNHYSLSIIELICKIVLFDYIGPVCLSVHFGKFGYNYFRHRRVLKSDSRKQEIISHSTTLSGACVLHCPNIIYNNMNNKVFCQNVFGFIMFASHRFHSMLTSPLYVEMKRNISDNSNSNSNSNDDIDRDGVRCYTDPKQYNRDKQMSILPLRLPNSLFVDKSISISILTRRANSEEYLNLTRTLVRHNSIILETFNNNNKKKNNNINIDDDDTVYCQRIVFLWEKCGFYGWRNETTLYCSVLEVMCNPNQFNPFNIDGKPVIDIEIKNILQYPLLSHLNKNGTFNHDKLRNNNNNNINNNNNNNSNKPKRKKKK